MYKNITMNKYPDNIVFNYDENKFDAYKKDYPTSASSQNFSIDLIDKSLPHECKKHFKTQLKELQEKYIEIKEEYKWTELIYKADFRFKPDVGSIYHLYKKNEKSNFLSIIDPESWDKVFLGSFKLLSFGKWKKI